MKIFIGFPVRILLKFLIFLLKIVFSAFFVMILQVKVQERTLEEMLEQQLKTLIFCSVCSAKIVSSKGEASREEERNPFIFRKAYERKRINRRLKFTVWLFY